MLSTLFPRSPWFFLQVVAIIDITSNLFSNSKEPLKYPKVFMTDPSNWQSSQLLFCKVGFPMCSQKFPGKRYLTAGIRLHIRNKVVHLNL